MNALYGRMKKLTGYFIVVEFPQLSLLFFLRLPVSMGKIKRSVMSEQTAICHSCQVAEVSATAFTDIIVCTCADQLTIR
jgi:hypothetical protein